MDTYCRLREEVSARTASQRAQELIAEAEIKSKQTQLQRLQVRHQLTTYIHTYIRTYIQYICIDVKTLPIYIHTYTHCFECILELHIFLLIFSY